MILQNVQVILAVDPTMQGNNGTAGIPNHNRSTFVLHCGKKAVRVVSLIPWAASTHKPALQLRKEKNCTRGEYHVLPLVCRTALEITTSLQPISKG